MEWRFRDFSLCAHALRVPEAGITVTSQLIADTTHRAAGTVRVACCLSNISDLFHCVLVEGEGTGLKGDIASPSAWLPLYPHYYGGIPLLGILPLDAHSYPECNNMAGQVRFALRQRVRYYVMAAEFWIGLLSIGFGFSLAVTLVAGIAA